MNRLIEIDPTFDDEINAITARLFERKRLEIHDYQSDEDFQTWYVETTGTDFSDEDNISDAIDSYNQIAWCETYCNPLLSPPALFHCRPVITGGLGGCNGNFKDYIGDPNGYILQYLDGKFQQVKCAKLIAYENAVAEAQKTEILKRANIPPLFKDKNFETYKPQNESQKYALGICRRAAQTRQGLYLCGPVATGKTHLAIAVLKEHLAKGYGGMFIRAVDFLQRLRPPNNDYSLLDRARETSLLVFDDLGMQSDTQWTFEKITDVIDYRNANLLPTIITSNLTLELMDEGGLEYQRIASRIQEGCEILLIKGGNYRRQIAIDRSKREQVSRGATEQVC